MEKSKSSSPSSSSSSSAASQGRPPLVASNQQAKQAKIKKEDESAVTDRSTRSAQKRSAGDEPNQSSSKKARGNKNNRRKNNTPKGKPTVAITPVSSLSHAKLADNEKEDDDDDSNKSTLVLRKPKEDDSKRRASRTQSLILSTIDLPHNVPNLFSHPKQETAQCQCHHFQSRSTSICLGACDTVVHLNNYGWEYKALLKEMEDREYKYRHCSPTTIQQEDPFKLLTISGMVPPPDKRTREQTEWASPSSMDWTLENYMDRQPDLAPRMRGILIDWIIELSEEYKMSPYTLHLAITLIDKSMACTTVEDKDGNVQHEVDMGLVIPRDQLQCLGCACTWIAAKMEEVGSQTPSVDDLVFISDNIYQKEQILDMEVDVCAALKFRLQHVTPVHFAHEYLLASQEGPCRPNAPAGPPFHCILKNMVHYLLEIARIPYELMPVKPSLLAAAAIFLARATLDIHDETKKGEEGYYDQDEHMGIWSDTLECYTGYEVKDFRHIVRILHDYHSEAESSNLKAVFNKYSKTKFLKVSHKLVLSEFQLDLILGDDDDEE